MTWETGEVPEQPSYIAPSGKTEIRLLPSLPRGELTHATVPAGGVSKPACMEGLTEAFYILAGQGELWRANSEGEEVTPLLAGRCVMTPPGIEFQYRAARSGPLTFIVGVMPRWTLQKWRETDEPYWAEDGEALRPRRPAPSEAPWQTKDVPVKPDYEAPDGSEIRLLPECDAGGLAHCTLPNGSTARAVRHRTVDEIWYVLDGEGEVWRSDGDEQVVRVRSGSCLTIPCGTSFQFRADGEGPLSLLIGTFPRWTGPERRFQSRGAGSRASNPFRADNTDRGSGLGRDFHPQPCRRELVCGQITWIGAGSPLPGHAARG